MFDHAKIIVAGTGGQGVKMLAAILGNILVQLGVDVTVLNDYDAASRGGASVAYIAFDKKKVINPVVDEADFLLELGITGKRFTGRQIIVQKGVRANGKVYDFFGLGREKFGKPIYGSTIALGALLACLEVDLAKVNLRQAIPAKLPEENVEAVGTGYQLEIQNSGYRKQN
jgi:Pyruvate/2-oxoacid:ferredoxin oxidoreductase gamma subunit